MSAKLLQTMYCGATASPLSKSKQNNLMDGKSCGLHTKTCHIAPFAKIMEAKTMCLSAPKDMRWPDTSCHIYKCYGSLIALPPIKGDTNQSRRQSGLEENKSEFTTTHTNSL